MKPREPRQKVMVPARMRSDDGYADICIRDISSRGMMVQGGSSPERGTYIEILRPACNVTARVVWAKDGRFGVQTQDRISLDAFLDRRKTARAAPSAPPLVQLPQSPAGSASQAWHRADLSRQFSSIFQFAALAVAGLVAAVLAALAAYQPLAHALQHASQSMG